MASQNDLQSLLGMSGQQRATPLWDKQSERVLSGGLNWQSPDDGIGPSEAIEATNWRTSVEGGLRTRTGDTIRTAIGGTINAIYRLGNAQVVSVGESLSGGDISISGFASAIIFAVYWRSYIWATNRGKQAKYDLASKTEVKFTPVAPLASTITLTPTAGGGDTGLISGDDYTYWVTLTCDDGTESNPTSVVFHSLNPNQIAQITVTAPADPQVTGWNLYRSGGTLNTAYLLPTPDSAPLGFGGTYTDDGTGTNTDTALLQQDIPLEVDHDPPPAAAGIAGPYFDHLLMWSTAEHPNRLWWSKLDQPASWPGSAANAADGNWVDCGDTDPILNITLQPRYCLIYKTNQIYRLAGDPDDPNSILEPVSKGFGITNPKAVCSVGAIDLIEGGDGIYEFNGETRSKLTQKIDPLFQGFSPDFTGIAVPRALSDDKSSNCIGHHNGVVFFSYLQADDATRSTLVLDLLGRRWYQDDRAFTAFYDEGSLGDFLGANGSNLYSVSDSGTDQDGPINVAYHSRYYDQGAPENQKTYADVVVDCNSNGAALTVKVFYDHGQSTETPGTLNTTARTLTAFPLGAGSLGTKARSISLRVEGVSGDAGSAPVLLYGWTVHYRIEARDSLSFGTGPSDWGVGLPKQIDMIEVEFESNDIVNLQVSSNLPGGVMTKRLTPVIAIPSTSGARQCIEVPIRPVIEGRLIDVSLVSATAKTFRLYAVRARVRTIGWYIDGANSERWTTQELIPSGIA